MEDVAAADRVAGDHRHHRLRQPPHLHLQVGDVEAAERGALGDVAAVAADRLVAAGAERLLPSPVRTIAPTSVSSRASSSAAATSTSVCGRKAFSTSGRSIVILAIPSAFS